jgi:hypothetical protein
LFVTAIHLGMELPDGANGVVDRTSVLDVTYSMPQLFR